MITGHRQAYAEALLSWSELVEEGIITDLPDEESFEAPEDPHVDDEREMFDDYDEAEEVEILTGDLD
jgi:hypothetical protein